MSNVQIEFTVYRGPEEEEISLEIHGYCNVYVPAKLSGHPDTWAPPEGGESCVEEIFYDGDAWDGELTEEEKQEAETALMEKFYDDLEAAEERRAEAKDMDREFDIDYVYDDDTIYEDY